MREVKEARLGEAFKINSTSLPVQELPMLRAEPRSLRKERYLGEVPTVRILAFEALHWGPPWKIPSDVPILAAPVSQHLKLMSGNSTTTTTITTATNYCPNMTGKTARMRLRSEELHAAASSNLPQRIKTVGLPVKGARLSHAWTATYINASRVTM